jgi:Cof subfamily protein (haloacid dehalogenase superfamily)
MLAIDLDGTLLSPQSQVTARSRAAVHRALAAGLVVCFATGRNLTESNAILDAVGHHDMCVLVGGAMVVDVKRRVTLQRTAMEPALAADVCRLLEGLGHAALALQDTGETGVDYLITLGAPLNEATRQWMVATEAKYHLVRDLGAYEHPHTVRVGIVADPAEVARVDELIVERFGQRVVTHCLYVAAYGVEVMEVFDPAVSKWEGVLHVARRHGIEASQIVAIGDDVNDLTMIRGAGLGVAMGNAKPQVKAAAARVIGTNANDGLAEFLEEMIG